MNKCSCNKSTHEALRFRKCRRGYLVAVDERYGELGDSYAFDRIEDVAAWLVEQYSGGAA